MMVYFTSPKAFRKGYKSDCSVIIFSLLFCYSWEAIGNFHQMQSSNALAELELNYGHQGFKKFMFHLCAWLCAFPLHNLHIQISDSL